MRARPAPALVAVALLAGCAGRRPRDVENQHARSEVPASAAGPIAPAADAGPPRVVATPEVTGRRPRTLARGGSHAVALDATNVYFGADAEDALLAIPRRASEPEPTTIARRAPMNGALSRDPNDATLAWVAAPGDVVLRASTKGGATTAIREGGVFADVVAAGGDVFVTEVVGTGGVLTRVTGAAAARLGAFDGTPRGMVVDRGRVYVATSSRLLSIPRARGEATELAAQGGFASPQVDDGWVYATTIAPGARTRSLVRVAKGGGAPETLATGLRDAPIALAGGVVYWFDADRPMLLALDVGPPAHAAARVVSVDPLFDHVSALAADEAGVFAAVGRGDDACVVVVALPERQGAQAESKTTTIAPTAGPGASTTR
jgi:hypothetical protein